MLKNHALSLFALTLFSVVACGKDDPITAIDRTSDCHNICERYKDCLKSDYDVESCTDHCTDMVSSDETSKIDDCDACIDDKSCTASGFECLSECAGIVP